MNKFFLSLISLVVLFVGSSHAQNVAYELADKQLIREDGKQIYTFNVYISSRDSFALHSGQLYFNYLDSLLGHNLVYNEKVSYVINEQSLLLKQSQGTGLYSELVFNDNTSDRFSFSWQNNFSCEDTTVSSLISSEAKVLINVRVQLPAELNPEGLDLNSLVCFDQTQAFDDQTFACPGSSTDQIIADRFNCAGPDTIAPFSIISSSTPEVTRDNSVLLSWEGTDNPDGSGVLSYDLYVAENEGPFELYESGLTTTTYEFYGDKYSEYSFYTLAFDGAGNKEKEKTTGDVTVFFDNGVGITNNSLGVAITAYPNPVVDDLTLTIERPIRNVDIRVTNMLGEIVFSEYYEETALAKIFFEGATGIYFVNITNVEGKSAMFRVVKL